MVPCLGEAGTDSTCPGLGSVGKRKDTVINFECHVYLWLRCPRVQLMERSGGTFEMSIRLLEAWTCPLGVLVRRRESDVLPGQLGAEAQGGRTVRDWAGLSTSSSNQPLPLGALTEEISRGKEWADSVLR